MPSLNPGHDQENPSGSNSTDGDNSSSDTVLVIVLTASVFLVVGLLILLLHRILSGQVKNKKKSTNIFDSASTLSSSTVEADSNEIIRSTISYPCENVVVDHDIEKEKERFFYTIVITPKYASRTRMA